MLSKKEVNPNYLWLKVLVLILALVGVFWVRSSLDKSAQTNNVEDLAPIPAKVETEK